MIESYVVKTASVFMGLWGVVNGTIMTVAPDERFNGSAWNLVEAMPGGHDTVGALLVLLSVAFCLTVVIKNRFWAEWSCWGNGFIFISLAVAQATSALSSTTGGVMGGTSFFFIGMVYMLMGSVVRHKAST